MHRQHRYPNQRHRPAPMFPLFIVAIVLFAVGIQWLGFAFLAFFILPMLFFKANGPGCWVHFYDDADDGETRKRKNDEITEKRKNDDNDDMFYV